MSPKTFSSLFAAELSCFNFITAKKGCDKGCFQPITPIFSPSTVFLFPLLKKTLFRSLLLWLYLTKTNVFAFFSLNFSLFSHNTGNMSSFVCNWMRPFLPYSDNHHTWKNILRCMSLNARSVCNKLNKFHSIPLINWVTLQTFIEWG